MHGLLIAFMCLKCGNTGKKKYFVDTIDTFAVLSTADCSCGNTDSDLFKLENIDVSRAKRI